MSRLIDADALLITIIKLVNNSVGAECDGLNQCLEAINNAPTVEYPEQITIKCDTEEDKQKLLLALRNVRVTRVVEEERPQGEWILIAERLPDYMEEILITFQKPNREPLVYRAVFIGGKFALDNGDTWNWNDPEIKAWMPLPEAYKEAEND